MNKLMLGALTLAGFYGCSTAPTQQTTTTTPTNQTAQAVPKMNRGVGLDRANLATTASPCQDFFQYANGAG